MQHTVDPIPKLEPRLLYRKLAFAIGGCSLAVVLGLIASQLDPVPTFLHRIRLLLVAASLLLGGSTLAAGSHLRVAWLLAAVTCFLARFGLPDHWDSAQLVVTVMGVLSLVGCGLLSVPASVRYGLILCAVCYHFFGIFMATTWPNPTPWFTNQVGTKVYMPYLQFMYLKNAYHFYSPDPGPAHHLFFLITYDERDEATGKPKAEWVTMPSRQHNWRDPLGLSYFRRLSLTEQSSGTSSGMVVQSGEYREIEARRTAVAQGLHQTTPRIPLAPLDLEPNQYRMPRNDIGRYLLPSYAAHLLHAHSTPERKAKTVKIYLLIHPLPTVYQFAHEEFNPHHPTTFRPYYLGEFHSVADGKAELTDKQDPMLYWHTPILPKIAKEGERDYEDFMSRHAKYEFNWEARVP